MKSLLPKRSFPLRQSIEDNRGPRLCSRNQLGEFYTLQFDQPVKMVWHHHPGQRMGKLFFLSLSEGVNHQASCLEAAKKRLAAARIHGQ
ncbi:hypothetical protein PflQ8_0107 [Pseudomonas fluorescens Q8r1-96]|nr:hypothetical protein PflQ8_0107 [Pseudomonas fluorescens Q8r1-96]